MNRPRNWLAPFSVLSLAWMTTFFCTAGRSPANVMGAPNPLLMMMVLVLSVEPLSAMMAARSEPAPLSLAVVTVKSAACTGPAASSAAMEQPVSSQLRSPGRPSAGGPVMCDLPESGDRTLARARAAAEMPSCLPFR